MLFEREVQDSHTGEACRCNQKRGTGIVGCSVIRIIGFGFGGIRCGCPCRYIDKGTAPPGVRGNPGDHLVAAMPSLSTAAVLSIRISEPVNIQIVW